MVVVILVNSRDPLEISSASLETQKWYLDRILLVTINQPKLAIFNFRNIFFPCGCEKCNLVLTDALKF